MNEIENKAETDEAGTVLVRAQNSIRDLRVTGLGLVNKMNNQTKEAIDKIKTRSEEKLNTPESKDADSSEKILEKLSQSISGAYNQSIAYGEATMEEASDGGKKLVEWIKGAFEEEAKEESKEEAKEESESISRLARNLEKANTAVNRLYKDALDVAEQTLSEAKEQGKDVDFELRKAMFGRQSSMEKRIQQFWGAIGLVNKQEMEDVNRKLVLLAESLGNQLDEESKTLVYLNRRKNDRRTKKMPVTFDKRIYERRESDRKMAS